MLLGQIVAQHCRIANSRPCNVNENIRVISISDGNNSSCASSTDGSKKQQSPEESQSEVQKDWAKRDDTALIEHRQGFLRIGRKFEKFGNIDSDMIEDENEIIADLLWPRSKAQDSEHNELEGLEEEGEHESLFPEYIDPLDPYSLIYLWSSEEDKVRLSS